MLELGIKIEAGNATIGGAISIGDRLESTDMTTLFIGTGVWEPE